MNFLSSISAAAFAFLLLLLTSGCDKPALDYPFVSLDELAEKEGWEPLSLEDLFHENFAQILREADKIELNRIEIRETYHEELEQTIPTVERLIGPLEVSAEDKKALIEQLSTVSNYGVGLDCPFEPEILIRFLKEENRLDVLVNFSCAEVRLTSQGVTIHQQSLSVSKDLFRLLARLAEKHFPQDPYFQGLSEL